MGFISKEQSRNQNGIVERRLALEYRDLGSYSSLPLIISIAQTLVKKHSVSAYSVIDCAKWRDLLKNRIWPCPRKTIQSRGRRCDTFFFFDSIVYIECCEGIEKGYCRKDLWSSWVGNINVNSPIKEECRLCAGRENQ